MMDKLNLCVLGAKVRAEKYLERICEEEKGASDIVAILVIIVILIAVAGVFREGLMNLVSTVFSKVGEFVDG